MTLPVILISAVIVLLILVFIVLYNGLIKARNLVQTAFADIDVHLTKRSQLVPNIVSVAREYAKYESELLQQIVEKRNQISSSDDLQQTAAADSELTNSLSKLRITLESYPDLKANGTFLGLMEELSRIEDHLVFARRFYNGATRDFNNKVQSFPASMVAGPLGFQPKSFYEIGSSTERETPVI
jgi:LemA protein